MDRRHMEFQLRAILVTYRAELRRGHPLDGFCERARALLDNLEVEAMGNSELQAWIAPVRAEVLATVADDASGG